MNPIYLISGIIVLLIGGFLLISPLQSTSCHFNNECLGMDSFLIPLNDILFKNIYILVGYAAVSVLIILFGLFLLVQGLSNLEESQEERSK